MVRKKIIFVLTVLGPGGAEKVVSMIANNLDKKKYEPKVILFEDLPEHSHMLNDDVQILETNTKRIRESLFPILNIIRKEKPDIVFSSFGEVNAYISLFLKFFRKTKFIARETNVVSQHVVRPEIKFFYKFYNNYDKIICQSDDMQNDLLDNFKINPNKIVKINNPVDFDFINEKLAISERPKAFGTAMKNVVAIGNLSARKGFDNLLKVFSHLKNEKIKLHILGDGADKELLHQMKKDLGLDNVIFHGQQKNPYQFLKFADLFILSSRYEGFPNVLLEAGACGVYALANNCPGGINEIILPQINGEIADIENHETFAEKVKDLVGGNYDKAKIVNAIQSRFSKEIIMKKYEDTLLNW
ncbi:MAG: glycosyl transferase [Flavobacteriales bacterium]|nr:MAG: glycosyl transferase [Flavobacteriales bacterium]